MDNDILISYLKKQIELIYIIIGKFTELKENNREVFINDFSKIDNFINRNSDTENIDCNIAKDIKYYLDILDNNAVINYVTLNNLKNNILSRINNNNFQ